MNTNRILYTARNHPCPRSASAIVVAIKDTFHIEITNRGVPREWFPSSDEVSEFGSLVFLRMPVSDTWSEY